MAWKKTRQRDPALSVVRLLSPVSFSSLSFLILEVEVIVSASSHCFEVRIDVQRDARLWRGLPAPWAPSPNRPPHFPCFLSSVLVLGRARRPGLAPL